MCAARGWKCSKWFSWDYFWLYVRPLLVLSGLKGFSHVLFGLNANLFHRHYIYQLVEFLAVLVHCSSMLFLTLSQIALTHRSSMQSLPGFRRWRQQGYHKQWSPLDRTCARMMSGCSTLLGIQEFTRRKCMTMIAGAPYERRAGQTSQSKHEVKAAAPQPAPDP